MRPHKKDDDWPLRELVEHIIEKRRPLLEKIGSL